MSDRGLAIAQLAEQQGRSLKEATMVIATAIVRAEWACPVGARSLETSHDVIAVLTVVNFGVTTVVEKIERV